MTRKFNQISDLTRKSFRCEHYEPWESSAVFSISYWYKGSIADISEFDNLVLINVKMFRSLYGLHCLVDPVIRVGDVTPGTTPLLTKKLFNESFRDPPLGDPRGGGRPPRTKIFLISCSFWENLYVGASPWRVGAPSCGESWIRPCLPLVLYVMRESANLCLPHGFKSSRQM